MRGKIRTIVRIGGVFYFKFKISNFCFHSRYAKYQIALVKISSTAVKYHNIRMNITKRIANINIATIKNIFEVINQIARIIIIGKLKNITKLNITLKFNKNNKKYNLNVILKFSIEIFEDIHIDSKIHLLLITISYFGYANSIFNIVQIKNNTKNT